MEDVSFIFLVESVKHGKRLLGAGAMAFRGAIPTPIARQAHKHTRESLQRL